MRKRELLHGMDQFTRAYIECALWSSTDNSDESGGLPLDKNYGEADITIASLKKMIKDCADFQVECATDLAQAGSDPQNGHDFWLTRNGHGAGFWDRDYGDVGDRLSEACKAYGECWTDVIRGKVHVY